MKRALVWIVILAVLGTGAFFGYRWYGGRSSDTGSSFRFAPVQRQDVIATISATGTVVPEEVIDVGAQVNGQIATFGMDEAGKPVDYRSTVKADGILATIDDAIYAAQVASDQASLEQSKAAVSVAEATREQARARLDQAQRDWARAQKLGETQALSQADYDAAKSNYDQSGANLAVAEAQIGQAQAQVAIAQAALDRSKRNLYYCVIKSPVDGVIIDRRVEIGQTVVSSLNAPSLFLIAKDLSRMEVLVQVNEADIAHVQPHEAVTFNVDAFPGDAFKGEVRKVRLNATMTQNVVTYTVEIVTDNTGLKLLPYLTANVRFVTARRDQVLTVPNAALRWSPPGADAPPSGDKTSAGSATIGKTAPSEKAAADKTVTGEKTAQDDQAGGGRTAGARGDSGSRASARVWVLRDELPVAIRVRAGLSDGSVTEITTDELDEGDQVIVGQVTAGAAASGSTNPFAPQIIRGNRGGGGGGGRPAGGGGR